MSTHRAPLLFTFDHFIKAYPRPVNWRKRIHRTTRTLAEHHKIIKLERKTYLRWNDISRLSDNLILVSRRSAFEICSHQTLPPSRNAY